MSKAKRKQRKQRGVPEASDTTEATGGSERPRERPAIVPDLPGEGINRRRPIFLTGVVALVVLWLAFLMWMASRSG